MEKQLEDKTILLNEKEKELKEKMEGVKKDKKKLNKLIEDHEVI